MVPVGLVVVVIAVVVSLVWLKVAVGTSGYPYLVDGAGGSWSGLEWWHPSRWSKGLWPALRVGAFHHYEFLLRIML